MSKIRADMEYMAEARQTGAANPYSDRIDLLRARSFVLKKTDKALMQMYLRNGNTFSQMARVVGVNEATIARRIHKLTSRLLDGGYISCLRNRGQLSKDDLQVARDYLLVGLSQHKIAAKRDISVYQVRKSLRIIQRTIESRM